MTGAGTDYDWDDLRCFLAVMSAGATLTAARALGVNQSTVVRRIAALESALGLRLFDRLTTGYRPTDRARELLPLAEAVAQAAGEVGARTAQWRRQVMGGLRVTATEVVGNLVIAPLIAELREDHPGLTVELVADDRRLDLARGEADLAIRIGARPDQDGLVARRLPDSIWAIYAAPDYLSRRGRPERLADLRGHAVVLGGGHMADNAALAWLARAASGAEVSARVNSIAALVASVRAGTGISALPHLLAADASLVRLFGAREALASPVWLVYHQSQRERPELRLFVDAAVARFEALRPRLGPRD